MVYSYEGIDQTMYYLFNKIDHLLLAKMQIHLQVSNVEAKNCRKKKNLTSKPTVYFKTQIAEIKTIV